MNHHIIICTVITISALAIAKSCAKNDLSVNMEGKTLNETIPLSEAIVNLEETINSISIQTKTNNIPNYDNSDVIVLGNKTLALKTKAGEGIEIPDTLLYIVNFKDNEGFAVLAADKRISMPVLCITECGSLRENDFEDAIQCLQFNTKADDANYREMGENFVPALLLSSAIASLKEKEEGGNREGEGGEGNDIDYDSDYPFLVEWSEQGGVPWPSPYGPYIMTKWGQDLDPFNRYTPNQYPAGCATIALAQVLLANRYSNTMVFNGVTCNWDDMADVYNYLNYESMTNNGSSTGKEQVANFVLGLGSSTYLDLAYHSSGSHPSVNHDHGEPLRDAMIALGYSATAEYNYFSFSENLKRKTYDMLKDGYPVIAQGTSTSGAGGHVWVIDGYCCVIVSFSMGHYFHINWGWFGERDGYYNLGVFDTTNGVFHSSYDSSILLHQGNALTFNIDFAIIDYSI